jgi:hypothetical protein
MSTTAPSDAELFGALRARWGERLRDLAPEADVRYVEELLGYRLPPRLARVYTQLSDGGFGPGFGCWPLVRDRYRNETLAGKILEYRRPIPLQPRGSDVHELSRHPWPATLVDVADDGCGRAWFLDAVTEKVYYTGPDFVEDHIGFEEWMGMHKPVADSVADWLWRAATEGDEAVRR